MMNSTIDDNAVRAEAGMYFGGSLTGKSVDMGLKPRTPEEKLVAEGFWDSGYYEPEKRISDMAWYGFSLIGSYDIDDDVELYRFELDESKRSSLPVGRDWECHFQNVIMKKSNKAYTEQMNKLIGLARLIKK